MSADITFRKDGCPQGIQGIAGGTSKYRNPENPGTFSGKWAEGGSPVLCLQILHFARMVVRRGYRVLLAEPVSIEILKTQGSVKCLSWCISFDNL